MKGDIILDEIVSGSPAICAAVHVAGNRPGFAPRPEAGSTLGVSVPALVSAPPGRVPPMSFLESNAKVSNRRASALTCFSGGRLTSFRRVNDCDDNPLAVYSPCC